MMNDKVMALAEQKYFIAIIPPTPLRDQLHTLKETIGATYHTKGALKSPPHITLHMPFIWSSRKEDKLVEALGNFVANSPPIHIRLTGYGCFPPRVVYVAVEHNPDLETYQKQLFRYCKLHLNLFNANYQDRPFHPHITLAFRDLKKDQFVLLWDEVKDKEFNTMFDLDTITLLKHDGQRWYPFKEFPLG